jgi:2-methylcitrate dehydratase PrpD
MSGQTAAQASITQRLCARLAAPVGRPERERAALAVLDWAGCAIAGAPSAAGRTLLRLARAGGQGPCALIGGGRASALGAALGNGALGNVLEMDDVDKRAVLHPGPVVIPAALAAAEETGAGADAFLDAVVRGYEAVIAIGRAVGPGHYRYWHNTGTCGPFGAAAAATSLYGLGGQASSWALGLAGTQASGLWQTRHEPASLAKQLHTARAAEAGLLAAQLAREGFAGPIFILEGPQGFFAATCPGADPEAVFDARADWAILDVSIKPWPACRHAHAAIDAALMLRSKISTDAIAAIEVTSYPAAVDFCDKPDPKTVIEAKFSFQHAVAVTLRDGPPVLAAFEPAAIARPDLAALRALTKVKAGEPYASAYPGRFGAEVRVRLEDGTEHVAAAPDAWGDPENPVSEADVIAKARDLIAWGGRGDADRVIEAALGLAEGASLSAFAEALA